MHLHRTIDSLGLLIFVHAQLVTHKNTKNLTPSKFTRFSYGNQLSMLKKVRYPCNQYEQVIM